MATAGLAVSQGKQNKKTPDTLGHKSFGEIVLSGSQLIQIYVPSALLVKSFDFRQACSPLIQLFFGFASDIDQTNI